MNFNLTMRSTLIVGLMLLVCTCGFLVGIATTHR